MFSSQFFCFRTRVQKQMNYVLIGGFLGYKKSYLGTSQQFGLRELKSREFNINKLLRTFKML